MVFTVAGWRGRQKPVRTILSFGALFKSQQATLESRYKLDKTVRILSPPWRMRPYNIDVRSTHQAKVYIGKGDPTVKNSQEFQMVENASDTEASSCSSENSCALQPTKFYRQVTVTLSSHQKQRSESADADVVAPRKFFDGMAGP
jgi:hypothetical protein